MQFISSRTTQGKPTQSILMFSQNYIRPPPRVIAPPTNEPTQQKKMKWGEPTWFLLHTLAEKVKEESFLQIRSELLKQIYAICTNLPCPICATHARDYLNGINFSTIQTKEALKKMLFTFHNVVNANKGYALFPYEELEKKYSTAVTANIINYFFPFFQEKQYNVQLISNNVFRERITKDFKTWIALTIQKFAQ
jgi:hypothetical protein